MVSAVPNNIVEYTDRFIGREQEINELAEILRRGHSLITIVAPGGYGKSRLANEACLKLLENYKDGVYIVSLAPVGDSDRIAATTAEAIGFQFFRSGDHREQLISYLRNKRMLLCFDNFEQVVAGANMLGAIQENAPKVDILVTSREILHLDGETVFKLDALPVEYGCGVSIEEGIGAAMMLFADRAAMARRGFVLHEETKPLVKDICYKLEGVPLAIEIAAAWMDELDLGELSEQVQDQLDMTAKIPTLPLRHRSVRASCDWSYAMLDANDQLVLRCISTFKGGFTPVAAQAVIPLKNISTILDRLKDKSWLNKLVEGEETRYYMCDAAIREYCFRKLLDSDDYEIAVISHCRYCIGILEKYGIKMHSRDQLDAIRHLRLEQENIYEALDTACRRQNLTLILPFARHLSVFLSIISQSREAMRCYKLILSKANEFGDEECIQNAYLGLGRAALHLGKHADAKRYCLASRDIAERREDKLNVAKADLYLGNLERLVGHHKKARDRYNDSMDVAKAINDRYLYAMTLHGLGQVVTIEGNYDMASNLMGKSLEVLEEMGDGYGSSMCLNDLGNIAYREGRYAEARDLHTRSLAIRRKIGYLYGIAQSINNLGNIEFSELNYTEAWTLYSNSLKIKQEIGEKFGIAASLNNLGNVEFCMDNFVDARRLHSEGLELKRELDDRNGIAFSLNNLANVSIKLKEYERARDELKEALMTAREIGSKEGTIPPLAVSAGLFALMKMYRTCAVVYFGVTRHMQHHGLVLDPMDQGMLDIAATQLAQVVSHRDQRDHQETAAGMQLDVLVQYAISKLTGI